MKNEYQAESTEAKPAADNTYSVNHTLNLAALADMTSAAAVRQSNDASIEKTKLPSVEILGGDTTKCGPQTKCGFDLPDAGSDQSGGKKQPVKDGGTKEWFKKDNGGSSSDIKDIKDIKGDVDPNEPKGEPDEPNEPEESEESEDSPYNGPKDIVIYGDEEGDYVKPGHEESEQQSGQEGENEKPELIAPPEGSDNGYYNVKPRVYVKPQIIDKD